MMGKEQSREGKSHAVRKEQPALFRKSEKVEPRKEALTANSQADCVAKKDIRWGVDVWERKGLSIVAQKEDKVWPSSARGLVGSLAVSGHPDPCKLCLSRLNTTCWKGSLLWLLADTFTVCLFASLNTLDRPFYSRLTATIECGRPRLPLILRETSSYPSSSTSHSFGATTHSRAPFNNQDANTEFVRPPRPRSQT